MTRDALGKAASRFARPLATVVALGAAALLFVGPGCTEEGIGDPCTPEQEYNADFVGFSKQEVSIESKSFQCRTRVCLVNHFQGRVSCPYGQGPGGEAPAAGTSCVVPGTDNAPVVGAKQCKNGNPCTEDSECDDNSKCDFVSARDKSTVKAQCLDRKAAAAVYCSCRCADINGQRPGDQAFCDCPDGFKCERLVTSIGQGNEGLTGSYCIKNNTQYDAVNSCSTGECDPASENAKCD